MVVPTTGILICKSTYLPFIMHYKSAFVVNTLFIYKHLMHIAPSKPRFL